MSPFGASQYKGRMSQGGRMLPDSDAVHGERIFAKLIPSVETALGVLSGRGSPYIR